MKKTSLPPKISKTHCTVSVLLADIFKSEPQNWMLALHEGGAPGQSRWAWPSTLAPALARSSRRWDCHLLRSQDWRWREMRRRKWNGGRIQMCCRRLFSSGKCICGPGTCVRLTGSRCSQGPWWTQQAVFSTCCGQSHAMQENVGAGLLQSWNSSQFQISSLYFLFTPPHHQNGPVWLRVTSRGANGQHSGVRAERCLRCFLPTPPPPYLELNFLRYFLWKLPYVQNAFWLYSFLQRRFRTLPGLTR